MGKFTLFSFFILISALCSGQSPDTHPWCPPGATWVYQYFSSSSTAYYRFSYIKDTTVAGTPCKQMEVTRIEFIGTGLRLASPQGFEYYSHSNDSVFFYDGSVFRFIYNFNAAVNDEWVLKNNKTTCNSPFPASDTIKVIAKQKDTIGNRIYDITKTTSISQNYLIGSIIKNIGSDYAPYPVISRVKCSTANPFIESGLICYRDNSRGIVPLRNTTTYDCNTIITSIPYLIFEVPEKVVVFPNPSRKKIFIKTPGPQKGRYIIYNSTGALCSKGNYTGNGIDIELLPKGFYFLVYQKAGRKYSSGFMKS